nr:MAG TPA: hypothetical protein [Caudoviricetes sp.]
MRRGIFRALSRLGVCLKNRHALHLENRGLFGCFSVGSPAPCPWQALRLPAPRVTVWPWREM